MKFYQSKLLNNYPHVTHCFTTKKDKNLAFHVNDDIENVLHNHKQLANKLGYDRDKLIHMRQIHSNKVFVVADKHNFENPLTCDAIITNKTETPLMVMVADCSPILFYDDVKKVIAVAHAGRAGAFFNIVAEVLKSFEQEFDSNISDIKVSIGPAIGSCCYEVGEEISDEANTLNLSYAIKNRESKFYLDIRAILKTQLLKEGILEKNLEISSECNCCSSGEYYSYRKEHQTGRFAGVILLKQ